MRIVMVILGLVICAAVAGAAETDPNAATFRFRLLVSVGLTDGGDTIASYRMGYFGDEFNADVDGGGTFYMYGGFSVLWPRHRVGFVLQGGYFAGGVGNYEERADFDRWPIELMGFYQTKRIRFGVGMTHHFSPTFKEKKIGNIKLKFDDASGSLAQIEYLFNSGSVGVRYVQIDYPIASTELNGDHWGLFASYHFDLDRATLGDTP